MTQSLVADIQPTYEQQQAVDKVVAWFEDIPDHYLTLAGLAGTGKTVTSKMILSHPVFAGLQTAAAAFTGKAASVLRRKGVHHAQTLHSLMYEARRYGDELVFERRDCLEADFVLVDEGSMVSGPLYTDLMSFEVPVLFVGDHGQLEPIGENPRLMDNPDIVLTEIHRQAAGSPIIQFAHGVRRGEFDDTPHDQLYFGDMEFFESMIYDVDQVIVGFNVLRQAVNRQIREHRGYTGDLCVGEKLICLKNDPKRGIFNGMIVFVDAITADDRRYLEVELRDEDGVVLPLMKLDRRQLGGDPIPWREQNREYAYFDWAYACTVHKFQGSEAGSVAVYEQAHPSWDMDRWRYTAATRASDLLVYCRG